MITYDNKSININAGKAKMTKFDPATSGLSSAAADIRVLTETISKIELLESIDSYELPDGNSSYPMGKYPTAAKTEVNITFSSMSDTTLAYIKNVALETVSETMHITKDDKVPEASPYEIVALGNIAGTPIIMDANNQRMTKVASAPAINQFSVTAGTTGTKQSMSKTVTTKAATGGTATITVTAAGSPALVAGKAIAVTLSTVDVNTNASEVRSVLQSDPDIAAYYDVSGASAEVILTRKVAAASESASIAFTLGTAVAFVMGSTTTVAGVADVPAKLVFNAANASAPITYDYDFNATGILKYSTDANPTFPQMRMDISYETSSEDQVATFLNNSIIYKLQPDGSVSNVKARQHEPITLKFTVVKPDGAKVMHNAKVRIK